MKNIFYIPELIEGMQKKQENLFVETFADKVIRSTSAYTVYQKRILQKFLYYST